MILENLPRNSLLKFITQGFLKLSKSFVLEFKITIKELKQNSVSTISVDSRARNFSALMGQLYSWNDNIDALLDEYNDNEELAEEKYLEGFQRIYLEMKEILSEN